MASKNIISILINSVFKGEGVKDAEKSVKGLSSGLDGVNRALGAFGLALGAKEVFDFALRSRQAAIEAENARNKLTLQQAARRNTQRRSQPHKRPRG